MKLTIPERLTLLGILPQQGSVLTMHILREFQSNLSFTEAELKKYKMKIEAQKGRLRVKWDNKVADGGKEFEIGDATKAVVVKQLKQLDKKEQITINMLPLYKKFVENETKD